MKKIIILIFLILLAVSVWKFERLLGIAVEPVLEGKLTSLFGMPVQFQSLKANPFTGWVKASSVQFLNQAGFPPGPHLNVKELEFRIDFPELYQEKHVLISILLLTRPLYFIESVPFGKKDSISNVKTWVRHIKKKKSQGQEKRKEEQEEGEKKWKVTIDEIVIRDGTFIFKKEGKNRKKFVFQGLNGFLKGFEWPTPDPAFLGQEVQLEGAFGEERAPMSLKGRANFATSRVSFNIQGEIQNGDVEKHPFLWEGLPMKVRGGKFFLKTKIVCVKRQLEADSVLVLNSLELAPKQSASTLIWGLPVMAAVGFLQKEKAIHLQVPVKGDISDPQFGFTAAFQKAFQDSLNRYTKTGNEMLTAAPKRVFGEIGKISNSIVRNMPSLPSLGPSPAPEQEKQN